MNRERIAKKLIELRGDRSRSHVANDLGISLQAIQMYENGKRIPKDELKIKIANYYQMTVQEIFFSDQYTQSMK